MKKLSLFLIVFLLLVGVNSYATTMPMQSLILKDSDTNVITGPLTDTFSYTVADRDKSTWGTYQSIYYGYTSSSEWTGNYIGTIQGENDSQADLENLIQYYFNDYNYILSIDSIDKVDQSGDGAGSGKDGALTVNWDEDQLGGTWSIADSPANEEQKTVQFYAVKGAKEYALYYLDPSLQDGVWSTTHLLTKSGNIPTISHLTVTYSSGGTPTAPPVPEPATMMLFGIGLIGLAGISRRRINK